MDLDISDLPLTMRAIVLCSLSLARTTSTTTDLDFYTYRAFLIGRLYSRAEKLGYMVLHKQWRDQEKRRWKAERGIP